MTNNYDFCLKKDFDYFFLFDYFNDQLVVTALLRIAVNERVIYTRPWMDRQITHTMKQHAFIGMVVVLLRNLLPAMSVSLPQLLVAHLLDLGPKRKDFSGTF